MNWLPVGLTLEEQRSDRGFSNYHYTDSGGCWLDVELLLFSSGGVMSLDTENADVRETVISGYPAITIHKEGVSVAACTLEDLNAILLVTGQGFSVDDVVRVAESVRLRGAASHSHSFPATEGAKHKECTVCPEDKEQLSINSQPGAARAGPPLVDRFRVFSDAAAYRLFR